MPFYEFGRKDGRKRTVFCMMAELPALTEHMKTEGWERVYSVPQSIIRLSYHEALAESHQVVADEGKKMAQDRKEAARDLHEAVREELR